MKTPCMKRISNQMDPICEELDESFGLSSFKVQCTPQEVSAYLKEWDLAQYQETFEQKTIDGEHMLALSEDDLVSLGMDDQFHRLRFRIRRDELVRQKKIDQLCTQMMLDQENTMRALHHEFGMSAKEGELVQERFAHAWSTSSPNTAINVNEQYPTIPLIEYIDDERNLYINKHYPGLQAISRDPWIFIVNGFLDKDECESLIRMGGGLMMLAKAGAAYRPELRNACESLLDPNDVMGFQRKCSDLLNLPSSYFEALKVTNYPAGGLFRAHHDSGPARPLPFCTAPKATCIATVLVYLTDVERSNGGGTSFIDLNNKSMKLGLKAAEKIKTEKPRSLTVHPHRGMALVSFPATTAGERSPELFHEALPVQDSSKWIAQQWVWNGVVDLKKRPASKQPFSWLSATKTPAPPPSPAPSQEFARYRQRVS